VDKRRWIEKTLYDQMLKFYAQKCGLLKTFVEKSCFLADYPQTSKILYNFAPRLGFFAPQSQKVHKKTPKNKPL
jgi:hypothetical protein